MIICKFNQVQALAGLLSTQLFRLLKQKMDEQDAVEELWK